jgi:hypothetical protein
MLFKSPPKRRRPKLREWRATKHLAKEEKSLTQHSYVNSLRPQTSLESEYMDEQKHTYGVHINDRDLNLSSPVETVWGASPQTRRFTGFLGENLHLSINSTNSTIFDFLFFMLALSRAD